MKLFNKRTLIAAAFATAFVGVSATAIAQGMGMSPELHAQHLAQRTDVAGDMSQKQAQRMERMQKYHAERQTQLKAELKLTPAQEPAWNAFVARTAPEPRGPMAGAREDWSKLTTPQRLDRMQALRAERDAAMAKRIDATRSFYAALTPEQQKVFDAQGHGGFQRAGMKGEHRMGGQHGGHGGHHGMHDKAGMGGGMGCDGPMQPRS
jgi:hypothetical protein